MPRPQYARKLEIAFDDRGVEVVAERLQRGVYALRVAREAVPDAALVVRQSARGGPVGASATYRYAVEHGYVSMTPLRLDLTNEMELAEARKRHPLV